MLRVLTLIAALTAAPAYAGTLALMGAGPTSPGGSPPPPGEVTDDFNRANGGLGANWTNDGGVGGTWQIVSNAAVGGLVDNNEARATYTADTFENNQYAEITVTAIPSSDGPGGGPSIRMASNTAGGYSVYATTTTLYLSEAGGPDLDTYSHTLAPGDVIRIESSGTSITGLLNGSPVLSGTDGTYTTGYPGLIAYRNTTSITVDDFVAGPTN